MRNIPCLSGMPIHQSTEQTSVGFICFNKNLEKGEFCVTEIMLFNKQSYLRILHNERWERDGELAYYFLKSRILTLWRILWYLVHIISRFLVWKHEDDWYSQTSCQINYFSNIKASVETATTSLVGETLQCNAITPLSMYYSQNFTHKISKGMFFSLFFNHFITHNKIHEHSLK